MIKTKEGAEFSTVEEYVAYVKAMREEKPVKTVMPKIVYGTKKFHRNHNGRKCKHYSKVELVRIKGMMDKGYTLNQIVKETGRSKTAMYVLCRRMRLGEIDVKVS
jgi:uncharacterized short protein YbdD (DUF466 family)